MKSIKLLSTLLLLLFSTCLFSQKKAEFGFYAGTSMTSMSGVDKLEQALSDALTEMAGEDFPVTKSSRSFLFNGGCFLTYNFTPSVSLRGGLEYNPKGEKFNGELYGETDIYTMTTNVLYVETILHLSYIEFPVSVQFSAKTSKSLQKNNCYLNLGISPGILVAAKQGVSVRTVEKGFNTSGITEEPIDSQYDEADIQGLTSSDMGIFGSVGICSSKGWFTEIKVERGIKVITESAEDGDIRNNMVAMSFGYKF